MSTFDASILKRTAKPFEKALWRYPTVNAMRVADGASIVTDFDPVNGATSGNALFSQGTATFVGGIAGKLLTVTSVSQGALTVGQKLHGIGPTNLKIVSFGTGTGGAGTYNINNNATIAPGTAMTSGEPTEYLDVESQRTAKNPLISGLISGDRTVLNAGLLGTEYIYLPSVVGVNYDWLLERGGPTVDFNTYQNVHPKSEALDASAHGLACMAECRMDPDIRARYIALLTNANLAAMTMAQSSFFAAFMQNKSNNNQLFFPVVAMKVIGVLAGNQFLIDAANSYVLDILAGQYVDGTFEENSGFDFSYQSVSLELLARFISMARYTGEDMTQHLLALEKGWERWLSRINQTTGQVDDSDSTRTAVTGLSSIPGLVPKGFSVDVFPQRVLYVAHALGRGPEFAPLCDIMLIRGTLTNHSDE